ncbi:hypothetical protein QTP88_007551 [Uroleucon formosanum]
MIGGGFKVLTKMVVWYDTGVDFGTKVEIGFGTEVEVGFGTEVRVAICTEISEVSLDIVDILVSEKDTIVSESERFGEGIWEGGSGGGFCFEREGKLRLCEGAAPQQLVWGGRKTDAFAAAYL